MILNISRWLLISIFTLALTIGEAVFFIWFSVYVLVGLFAISA